MKALILAAGQGKRLQPLTNQIPKGLLRMGGDTLLDHQVRTCSHLGIREIGIVVGFRAELIKERMGEEICYVNNTDYAGTNSLYSFWLARDFLCDDVVVLNSDVLFHEEILGRLLEDDEENALAVEVRSGFDDEQMKIRTQGQDRLAEISKRIHPGLATAENLGIVKLSKMCVTHLLDIVEPLIQGARKEFFPYALNLAAPHTHFKCVDVGDLPWIEIDFLTD